MKSISDTRTGRAKLNILFSLLGQIITLICGIIVPRLLLGAFGSETYGATASIAQFLAYITLLEGGIAGVARAALYKPIAKSDFSAISDILGEIKRFFQVLAGIFSVYVIALAISFKFISGINSLSWFSSGLLVVVISISTFAEYYIGISYSVFLQASQKTYITATVNIVSKILNTIAIVFLVFFECDIIIVKLISSCIFVGKPIFLWQYVKRNYPISVRYSGSNYLKDKWVGLGQHMAYFLYSNTDIAVLTIMADLKSVAIYSVYFLIVSQIQNITTSFTSGTEALFGEMIAKKEIIQLNKVFSYYETIISTFATILFSVTSVMIVPFVEVYTSGIYDANYYQPIFSFILIIAAYYYCLRLPYHNLVIAAGHFKQTQLIAYVEAFVNIFLSLLLVNKLGLVGVAVGTLVSTMIRMVYYAFYLRSNIVLRNIKVSLNRFIINNLTFFFIVIVGSLIIKNWNIYSYASWVLISLIVLAFSIFSTLVINIIPYSNDYKIIINKLLNR